LEKLGDHFAALIARGLNPFWVRDDREHDHCDLFLYVIWQATEGNLLRGLGYKYQVSRQAVNYYVTHSDRLLDLCPRRLELIARAFAAKQPAAALEAQLTSMLSKDSIRPRLKVDQSWVTVPGGTLLWPEQPFSKFKPVDASDPPRRIRARERLYKERHGTTTPANDHPSPEPRSPASLTSPVTLPQPALLQASTSTEHQRSRDEAVADVTDNNLMTARTQKDSKLEPDLAQQLQRQKEITAALHELVIEQDKALETPDRQRNSKKANRN
jgi:hypothetical protein